MFWINVEVNNAALATMATASMIYCIDFFSWGLIMFFWLLCRTPLSHIKIHLDVYRQGKCRSAESQFAELLSTRSFPFRIVSITGMKIVALELKI